MMCPRCGANYEKAALIRTQGRAAAPQPTALQPQPAIQAPPLGIDERAVEDPSYEFWLCVWGIPAMLALALLFHFVMPGVQRIFLGMPIHELGHALGAWFCGYFAIPTLWKTLVFEERGVVTPIVLAAAIVWMMIAARRAKKHALVAFGALLLALQAWGTLGIGEGAANMVFSFAGDGIGMVLATLLMCSFFFGKRTQLYKGALRWGFVAIGAAAFTDMFATWWAARSDPGVIPFGEIEGVGWSDPMKLVHEHGWPEAVMVRRYVVTGILCLVALAAVYAWGVRRAWLKANSGSGS